MQFDKLIFLPYGFLFLATLSLWWPKKYKFLISILLLAFAIATALLTHTIKPVALIPIFLLAILLYCSQITALNTVLKFSCYALTLLVSIGLASHFFPGFNNLKVIDHIYISKDAVPYTLYLNFDKAIVGIFILGITQRLIYKKEDWIKLFKQTVLPFLVLIITVILLAVFLGVVRFDPKLPSTLPIWIITNLLFVSVAEEAIFRGFVQNKISLLLNKKTYGDYLAILISAVLFALLLLAHLRGGIKYILLTIVVGIGYGWLYHRTKSIESAIGAHFCLNLTQFLFFTYPMLASAI